MGFIVDGAAGEEWARRVGMLSEQERARRLDAVNVLLSQPDDLCVALESELHVLRSRLVAGGPAAAAFAGIEVASPAERAIISAARAARPDMANCACGDDCEDGGEIPPAVVTRVRAYREANPGMEIAWDEETGVFAVVIPHPGGDPQVVAWSLDLAELLDQVGVPPAEELS